MACPAPVANGVGTGWWVYHTSLSAAGAPSIGLHTVSADLGTRDPHADAGARQRRRLRRRRPGRPVRRRRAARRSCCSTPARTRPGTWSHRLRRHDHGRPTAFSSARQILAPTAGHLRRRRPASPGGAPGAPTAAGASSTRPSAPTACSASPTPPRRPTSRPGRRRGLVMDASTDAYDFTEAGVEPSAAAALGAGRRDAVLHRHRPLRLDARRQGHGGRRRLRRRRLRDLRARRRRRARLEAHRVDAGHGAGRHHARGPGELLPDALGRLVQLLRGRQRHRPALPAHRAEDALAGAHDQRSRRGVADARAAHREPRARAVPDDGDRRHHARSARRTGSTSSRGATSPSRATCRPAPASPSTVRDDAGAHGRPGRQPVVGTGLHDPADRRRRAGQQAGGRPRLHRRRRDDGQGQEPDGDLHDDHHAVADDADGRQDRCCPTAARRR